MKEMGASEDSHDMTETEAPEVEDDDHTVVGCERDSLQRKTITCNKLSKVQGSNIKDCSGLKNSREEDETHQNKSKGTEASDDSLDVPQERRPEETLLDKAGHARHFLGFSRVAGTVSPSGKKLNRRSTVEKQVQVSNHRISSGPICSGAGRESYLGEMIGTVTAEYQKTTYTSSTSASSEKCGTITKPELVGTAATCELKGHGFISQNSISLFQLAENGCQHPSRRPVHGGDDRGQAGRDEVRGKGDEESCGGVWQGSAENPRAVRNDEELSKEPPTRGIKLGERTELSLLDS
jgi:hypothetical protein